MQVSDEPFDKGLALDVYEESMTSMDEKTRILFRRLHTSIVVQSEQLKEMAQVLGALEMVSSSAAPASPPPLPPTDEVNLSNSSNDNDSDIIPYEIRTVAQMA